MRSPPVYPFAVTRRRSLRRSLHRILRASVLALLVLGLLVKPILVLTADAHEIQHALLAAAGPPGIPHFHGDRDDPQPNSDQTHGTRSLLWSAGVFEPITPVLEVPPLDLPPIALPPLARTPLKVRSPATPFRPPIA
jgi:hypothetical protein